MPEYIEREALIEKIVNTPTVPIKQCYEGNFVYADGTASRQNEIINYITEQPTADVVEVVRCKDCEFYKPYYDPIEGFYGQCLVRECDIGETDYCSYGERKEGAEE